MIATELLIWGVVPLMFLFAIGYFFRHKNERIPNAYIGVAMSSCLAALLVAPTCLCADPIQKVSGALLASVICNILVFGFTAGFLRMRDSHYIFIRRKEK